MKKKKQQRAAITLECLRDMDRRTTKARRIKRLAFEFADMLGGWSSLSFATRRYVESAAVLVIVAEDAQTDFAHGSGRITEEHLVRLVGSADRAIRRLGLEPDRDRGRDPELDDYLSHRETA